LFCEAGEAGHQLIAGVDEVGRGPLAGNVVAAAVVLNPDLAIPGLKDSKQLSPLKRESLAQSIKASALAFAIAEADVSEIDRINILQASLLAMQRAVAGLSVQPDFIYVDGNRCPVWEFHSKAVVKGDQLIQSIAAASILAKVYRDKCLQSLHEQYPNYGFARHKGYPTPEHLRALRAYGACPAHRRSFAPVKAVLDAI
tara:strand:- start:162 stop:758 length:597 start_codon:yes stop_codon:yes gene_type:complete